MKREKQSGITLVALVVTIVVILILAGVSINLVLGENGLITQSQEAKRRTAEATENEYESINSASEYINQEVEITASQITTNDYGKTITNYTAGEKTWEIFYADNNNIYLITRESVGNQSFKDKIGNYNGTSEFDGSESFKKKYPAIQAGWISKIYSPSANNEENIKYESNYENIKVTEYLLDSSVWNEWFKTENADWAIGAPTLEMFVTSYSKYSGTEITIDELEQNGYKETITEGITNEKANGLYNPGYSYWLASPSSYSQTGLRNLHSYGDRIDDNNYDYAIETRPVVCLNSTVTLIKNGDGSYSIK